MNFGFNVINGVGALNLRGDCLPCKGLNEDLHTSTKTEDEMNRRLHLEETRSGGELTESATRTTSESGAVIWVVVGVVKAATIDKGERHFRSMTKWR